MEIKAYLLIFTIISSIIGVNLVLLLDNSQYAQNSIIEEVSKETSLIECYACKGNGQIECTACGGTGKIIISKDCKRCYGSGKIYQNNSITNCTDCKDGKITEKVLCNVCNGSGLIKCNKCNGKGKI